MSEPRVTSSKSRRVVEHLDAIWTCYEGGACYRPDGYPCVCGRHRDGHDHGDEDKSDAL